jgi:HK97 family phage major capsid protein
MMRTPTEIMQAMQAIVDLSESETRALSDEEVTTYEGLEAELKGVQKTAELHSRQDAYKTPIVGFPALIAASPKGDEALEFAFNQYLRTGQKNMDIAHLYAQTEGSNAGGGYLVPPGFRTKLTERLVAFGGLAQEAETLDTGSGNPIEWPTVDDTSATRADVVSEGGTSAAGADIVFGTVTMGAYRYAATGTGNAPLKVSFELLQDSAFDVAAFVARALGTRIARKQAVDLMQGSGSGAPLGLLYGTHTGDVALAGGDAITIQKLNDLVHSLDPAYRPSAKWIFNDATAAILEMLVDSNSRPIMQSSLNGLMGSIQVKSVLGYPVVIDQAAFSKSNQVNFAAFGDLREAYIVRRVKDVQILVNPYSQTGYIVYDAWARMDGTIQNANAVKKLEGTT